MNSQALGLKVAGIAFGLLSLAQLSRLLIRPELLVAGHQVPLWPSGLAFVFLAGLSVCCGNSRGRQAVRGIVQLQT